MVRIFVIIIRTIVNMSIVRAEVFRELRMGLPGFWAKEVEQRALL